MKCRNCVHLYRDWCLHKLDSPDPDLDRECKDYKQATNADRIRAMSNEELAEFLIFSPEMEFDVCRFCEYWNTSGDDRGICLTKDGICRAEANCAAFKKWLRQPAEEDT